MMYLGATRNTAPAGCSRPRFGYETLAGTSSGHLFWLGLWCFAEGMGPQHRLPSGLCPRLEWSKKMESHILKRTFLVEWARQGQEEHSLLAGGGTEAGGAGGPARAVRDTRNENPLGSHYPCLASGVPGDHEKPLLRLLAHQMPLQT